MKKRTRKLALSKETVVTLSAPALTHAMGGKLRKGMTGEPTNCACPVHPGRIRLARIFEIRIRE